MPDAILGIDVGTSGLKVSLFDIDKGVIGSEYAGYPLHTPSPFMVEQEPSDWIGALIQSVSTLFKKYPRYSNKIIAIGIDGQMHTAVLLDNKSQILRRAITWMDQRSSDIVEDMNKNPGREFIFKHTLNFPTTTYLLPNLLWIKRYEQEVYKKIDKVLIAKDYVKYWLTGEMVTDPSDASGTLFFDVKNNKWSGEILNFFSIPKKWLPNISPSTQIIGKLSTESASLLSLKQGILVVNGCADHAATYIGGGVITKEEGAAIIGTAGVLSFMTDAPISDSSYRLLTWSHGIPGKWLILGVMQSAGASLKWFKDAFSSNKSYGEYSKMANTVPQGSEGLLFLPFLMGERTPYWNPKAKGVFYGITLKHTEAHFIRAIMEGVGFGLRNMMGAVNSLNIDVDRLKILGGGGLSKVWQHIVSDIMGKKIVVVKNREQATVGAAIIAGVGVEVYSSFSKALSGKIKVEEEVEPTKFSEYDKNFEIYKKLYEALRPIYERC